MMALVRPREIFSLIVWRIRGSRIHNKGDPMMRERKCPYVYRLARRAGFQPWQDPHATPAAEGLFEQNLVLTNHKCVLFGESLCAQSGFPDPWQLLHLLD